MKKKPKKKLNLDPLNTADLDMVLAAVGITHWDLLLVGDGSGSGWDGVCGWSAIICDRDQGLRKQICGAWNPGTGHIGELMPYLHALQWYMEGPGHNKLATCIKAGRYVDVRILTDAKLLADQGNRVSGRKACRPLWAAFDYIAGMGYNLHWHWMGRNRTALNRLADLLSRDCRINLEKAIDLSITSVEKVAPPDGISIYDVNSSTIKKDVTF